MEYRPRKFNPGLNQDDKSLIAQYVVRLPLLKILLDTIRDNADRPFCQHRLYYGPRGRGKTMLLARVAAELRVNPEFSGRWIPVRLLEESYYEIAHIGEFWLEVMSELVLSLPDPYRDNARLSLERLQDNWSHPDLEHMAQAAVLEQLDLIDKKAVIMIENLHQLLDEINDDDFGWAIRRVMQNEPRIMFLVTATTRFDHLDNARKPFFEIFATSELPPLKRSEAARLWNTLTHSDKSEDQIAPLDILTGGSPRLLTIVAQFARQNSIRELMENLTGLVDEYTEYFKSQLDALAAKERRVFLALADLWFESTAREIAERARMDIRPASALLGRLEHKGAIKVNADTPKRKTYLVAERLFCIYYKLRRERSQEAVIQSLVQFMVDFYTPKEIDDFRSIHLSKEALTEAEAFALEKFSSVYTKTGTSTCGISDADGVSPDIQQDIAYISAKFEEAAGSFDSSDFDSELEALESIIDRYHAREEPEIIERVAKAMFRLALTYRRQGETEKALAGYENLIGRYESREEPEIIERVAKAMLNQAGTYEQLGETEKALAGYASLIGRYESRKEPGIIEQVAQAAINRANLLAIEKKWRQAEQGYHKALSYLNSRTFPDQDIRVSTASLGMLLSKHAQGLSPKLQMPLARLVAEANRQSASEQRMTLAMGIAAILPADTALAIIQESRGNEALQPLLVALRRKKGETVRAAVEVLEVAEDVAKRLEKMRQALCNDEDTPS